MVQEPKAPHDCKKNRMRLRIDLHVEQPKQRCLLCNGVLGFVISCVHFSSKKTCAKEQWGCAAAYVIVRKFSVTRFTSKNGVWDIQSVLTYTSAASSVAFHFPL